MPRKINPSFSTATSSAVKKAEAVYGTRIREMTGSMQQAVIDTVREGMAKGEGPGSIALQLVGRIGSNGKREGGIVGLTKAQAATVRSYRAALSSGDPSEMRKALKLGLRDRRLDSTIAKAIDKEKKLPKDFIEKAVARYSNAALKYRAETISRTETGAIVLAGNQEAFRQTALKAGLGDNAIVRTWRTTGDDKVRDSHEAMDGVEVSGLDTPYELPDGTLMMHPLDTSLGAGVEEVANCRCDEEITVDYSVGLEDEEGAPSLRSLDEDDAPSETIEDPIEESKSLAEKVEEIARETASEKEENRLVEIDVAGPEGTVRRFTSGSSTGTIEYWSDKVLLENIETPKSDRGKGHASAVMQKIVRHLDNTAQRAELFALPLDDETEVEKLVKFYERYGFARTGRFANNRTGAVHMARLPKSLLDLIKGN